MFAERLAPSSEWKDFVGGDANLQEVSGGNAYGHGTAVAGIILQVAPKAKILPIRALRPDGSGDVATIAAAIDWAVQKNARIINLSLGTNLDVSALKTAVDYATSMNIYVVASAGNEGNGNSITYPAAYASAGTYSRYLVSVGSTTATSVMSSFSNRSPALEVAAPGEQIFSAYPGNQVAHATGTSFAAPIVSGLLALLAYETGIGNTAWLENYLLSGSWAMIGGGKHINAVSSIMALPDYQWNKNVLLVVGNATLNTGDSAIQSVLWRMGYNAVIKTASAATSADASGKTAVLISSTVNSTDVGTKFKSVSVPVVTWEAQLFDDMGMTSTSSGDFGTATGQTQIGFVNTAHPMAAGLSQNITDGGLVYAAAGTMTWGKPAASAIKVATLISDSSKAVVFGYNTGAAMVGLTAPARRVGLLFHDTSASNATGYWSSEWLFKAALTWAISGN
jgi:hypothetical protein